MLLFIWSDHGCLVILIVMMTSIISLMFATLIVATVVIRSDDVALD